MEGEEEEEEENEQREERRRNVNINLAHGINVFLKEINNKTTKMKICALKLHLEKWHLLSSSCLCAFQIFLIVYLIIFVN